MEHQETSKKEASTAAAEDEHDHEAAEGGQQPLLGVILCCTSIQPEQRDQIVDAAKEMGAVSKLDLTSDVTHLIVGSVNTPKYKYVAKERSDMKVLDVSWLEAVRGAWLAGDSIDLDKFDTEHRLATFYNLRICVTGFDDMQTREQLSAAIRSNGAEYHGDLTRNVTHLIAAAPKGRKYEYAGQWGVNIVAVEWLHQSISRGMVLDEALFHPLTPSAQRGVGAYKEQSPTSNKRKLETAAKQREAHRRKLRRTASTRLESQNDNIWADIGSGEPAPGNAQGAEWAEGATTSKVEAADGAPPPIRNAHAKATAQQRPQPESTEVAPSMREGQFQAHRFCIRGFATRQTDILLDHLVAGGAEILSWNQLLELQSERDGAPPLTVLLPHNADDALIQETRQHMPQHCSIASEWWVEKCIFEKSKVPRDSVLSRPFNASRIEGFGKVTLCPTSFAGIDLLHFSKAMKAVGAAYNETLTPKTDVLVCGVSRTPKADKLRYAMAYGIPIVTSSWALACIQNHRVEKIDGYLLAGQKGLKPLPLSNKARDDSMAPKQSSRPLSQPLREITANANSQSKSNSQAKSQKSQASDGEAFEDVLRRSRQPEQPQQPDEVRSEGGLPVPPRQDSSLTGEAAGSKSETPSAAEQQDRVKEAIEQLQRRQKEATGTSGADLSKPRRHRQLGRAPSNPSSLSARTASEPLQSFVTAVDEEDEVGPAVGELRSEPGFRPSQMLTYENDESIAAKQQILKRNQSIIGGLDGTDGARQMQRVERIGMAKDGPSYDGPGLRKTTRRRA